MRDFRWGEFEKRANGATKFAARQNHWGGERGLLAIGKVERQALCTQYLHFRSAFHPSTPQPLYLLFIPLFLLIPPLTLWSTFSRHKRRTLQIFRRDAMKLMTPENERRSEFSKIVFSHHVTAFADRVFPETRST